LRVPAILLFVALACGQQPQPSAADVVIRSNTRLVEIHVFARDSQDRSLTGLRREEFEILDNGKPQPVTLFLTEHDGIVQAALPAQAGVEGQDAEAGRAPYSLILLDWLNTTYTDRIFANDKVSQLLKRAQPGQRVGLAMLAREWRLLHDFTTEPAELLSSLENPELQADATITAGPGAFDARNRRNGPGAATVEQQIFDLDNKIHDTLRALDEIAVRLSPLPGRKSLVWITNAFPLVIDSSVVRGAKPMDTLYVRELDRLLARLNAANIAVYTIDARGLPASPGPGWVDTMQEISAGTGGTTFSARNDLDEGVRLALEDARVSYTLGFLAPDDAAPGMHTIRVRVKRPGIRLRYRSAYRVETPAKPQ
jgi:VWFA-related protein